MRCPYCNNEMQNGFVQCRDGVYWTPDKQWMSTFVPMAKGSVPIGTDDKWMPNGKAVAYHCVQCKMVIIPYEEHSDK